MVRNTRISSFLQRQPVLASCILILLAAPHLRADTMPQEQVYAVADAVRAWPMYYDAEAIPDADRASLAAAVALSSEALDVLVISENPRHRALAVRLANCRGDIERMRSWKHLLKDETRGLPTAGYSAVPSSKMGDDARQDAYIINASQPPFVEQTYRAAYSAWFGIPRPRVPSPDDPLCLDHDAVDYPVNDQTDLSKLVQPWVRRLELANQRRLDTLRYPGCLDLDPEVVLAQIKALDPALRWGVIMKAEEQAVLEPAEAQALLDELPQSTRAALVSGTRVLTDDPAYAHPDSEAPLRARFLELIEESPPPGAPE